MREIRAESEPSAASCCMCGDFGLSNELFQCQLCQFRSQHRYCSNLYPKAESYIFCNWCIHTQKDETKEKSQNSSSSFSFTTKSRSSDSDYNTTIKKSKNSGNGTDDVLKMKSSTPSLLNSNKNNDVDDDNNNNKKKKISIKKLERASSPERSFTVTRKRIITNRELEEKLMRRTRSDHMEKSKTKNINKVNSKPVFRNKVRRYKLLEEVSS